MPDDLRPLVLDACLALMARGVYPSIARIGRELPHCANHTYIWQAKRDLIAAGRLPAEAMGVVGGTPDDRAAIDRSAAAIRAELTARPVDAPVPVTGKLLLDQMASPGLAALSPAQVSEIVRRRCRSMFPARRQAASA